MLTPQQAAEQAGVSQRTVFRWIDEGTVHFAETAEEMFVCLAPKKELEIRWKGKRR
jgi:hypothetical protein